MQDRRRVGGVADHHQIRLVGHGRRIKPEAVLGAQQHPAHLVPGRAQRRLGLGELRMDDDRPPGLSSARAISTNASAAPAVSNTRSTGSPCRRATAARAGPPSG